MNPAVPITRAVLLPRLPRLPRAVVFDLDGTLIASEQLVLDAHVAVTARLGLPFTRDQYLAMIGIHRAASEVMLREYFGPEVDLPEFFVAINEYIGEGIAPLKPGAVELFAALDASATPFALATSSGRPWTDKHFSAHGLTGRFRAVITRESVTNGKPHPEPYLRAAEALGVAPADVLAIEDSPTGLRSAHAAGMMTVLAPDLLPPDDATRDLAHVIVDSLHDVLALLDD
jgi:HAD superfamily hydrolase (TIGR01509 family)